MSLFDSIIGVIESLVSEYELDILVKEVDDSPAVPLFKKVYSGEVGVYAECFKVFLLVDDDELDILFDDIIAMNVISDVVGVFEDNFCGVDVEYSNVVYGDDLFSCVVLYF